MKSLFVSLFLSQIILGQTWTGFGRNKIQYENFEWYILKTEHFDVYYYPEMESLAEKGAFWAEEAYKKMSSKFNHTVRRRIPIIFYSTHIHFQQTNITPAFLPEGVGGFFEFIKGRVIIPANGNLNQFKKVINHEIVHVFMRGKANWLANKHGSIESASLPLWYTEGLADMYSNDDDPNYDMVVKDALFNNYLPTIDEMWRIYGTFTMYKVGENILRFMRDAYGEQKVLQLIDNSWKTKKFSDVFYLTLGMTYSDFSRQWHFAMKKKYFPILETQDFAEAVTPNVDPYRFNFKPTYSKKTNEIVFWSNRTGYTGIYKTRLKSKQYSSPDLYSLDEAATSSLENIITGEKTGDYEGFHIFENKMDISSENILIFTSKTQGSDALYFYDLNNKEIIDKRKFDKLVSILSPAWSPDMQSIVFSGIQKSGYTDIFRYYVTEQRLEQLTDDFYSDNDPEWSHDGKYIVFSSDRGKNGKDWAYNIFRYQLDKKQLDQVTFGTARDLSPSYSPNGEYIAYVSTRNNQKNIYLRHASLNSHPEIKLTDFTSAVFDIEWISDDQIIFSVFNNARFKFQSLENIQAEIVKQNNVNKMALLASNSSDSNNQIQSESMRPDDRAWLIPSLAKTEKEKKERYSSDYDIDIAQSQVSQDPIFGTTGGVALGITDMLGDDKYIILAYNNAQGGDDILSSFNFRVTKYSLGQRLNIGYGLFRFSGRRFDFKQYYDESEIGGDFVMQYPLNQFNRIELYSNLRYSERRDDFAQETFYSWLNTTSMSYVRDNTIWSSTGPIDGERLKISIGFTEDFANSNISYFTYLIDLRKYFRLSLRSSYAVRFMGLMNNGKQTRFYAMGGSWDLRGYKFLKLRGEKLLLLTQEYRFPLFDFFGFKFSSGPALGSNLINGAIFVDAGNAYQSKIDLSQIRGSLGFGIRMNFMGALVLRWDIGKRTNFKTIETPTFMHFFFGWDF